MATKLQELRERKKQLIHDIREATRAALAGEGGVAQFENAEAEQRYDAMNDEYDQVEAEIVQYERGDKMRERLSQLDEEEERRGGMRRQGHERPIDGDDEITEETRSLAFTAWTQAQMEVAPSERAMEAAKRVGINIHAKKLTIRLDNDRLETARDEFRSNLRRKDPTLRSLSGSVIGDGGALVPSTLLNSLEVGMLSYSGMWETADIIRTQGGEEMSWPGVDDTSNEGRILGESETEAAIIATGEGKQPAFTRKKWGAFTFTSDPVKVETALIEDAAAGGFNLPQILGMLLGERLGRVMNRKCTVGNGANEPFGLTLAAAIGKLSASPTAIVYDDVIDLEGSLEPSHEANASYQFHKLIETYLRKIKDGDGRPLWQNGFREGVMNTFNGREYTRNQHMDSTVVANNKTMSYGDHSKYKIRQVNEIRIYRLEERFRTEDKDGFVAFLRADGNLLRVGTDALSPVQLLKQSDA